MSARERHPGDRLAALVDGRLAEPDRSRVIDHLTRCRPCLADYDAQLALKGLLGGLPAPGAPDELAARLAALPSSRPAEDPAGAGASRPSGARRATTVAAAALSVSVLVVAGVAYAVGGTPAGTAVVPPADRFLREHAAVSVSVPLTQPLVEQVAPQPLPFVAVPTAAPVLRSSGPGSLR